MANTFLYSPQVSYRKTVAKRLLQGLLRLRFLWVAALAMTLLSSPFLTDAGSKSLGNVSILEAPGSVAGMSSEIVLQGKAYKNLEVNIQKPDSTVLILETVTDAQGKAELNISEYHLRQAGIYKIAARELESGEAYGKPGSFEVFAGPVSESNSQIDLSKNSAELGETVELTVSLLDSYGNEIDGHVLKVIPNDNAVSVYTPEFATDENGHMNFYLTSEKKGIYEFTVFDSSINKTLWDKPKLAFSSGAKVAEIGGHDEDDIFLAEESGSIDSFKVTLPGSLLVGDDTTVVVTAIDESGFTVSDYTGTLRFASSDSEATLPNDYTFLAEDQGEHSFSLAVKFVTPGTQTLSVTDIEKFSITGEAEFKVSTSTDAGTEPTYGSDFETTDYERDGDFTLISPAAGTYSGNTLEVQGEAEYGYTAFILVNEDVAGHVDVDFDNSFSYTLQALEDGDYDLYVDIVDVQLTDDELTDEEIDEQYADDDKEVTADDFALIETSDSEQITIDTTAPSLASITVDTVAEAGIVTGQSVTVTVLSEADLEEASVLFQEEVYALKETGVSGKYEVVLIMPETEGEYALDVILMDTLGNEVQYRDQLALTVTKSEIIETEEPAEEEPVEDAPAPEEEPEMTIEAVSGLSATGAEEKVILSWEEPESEETIAFYRVYYGPSEESLFAVSETTDSSTTWSIEDLTAEERYYFAVAAVDSEGTEGELSEAVLGIPELGREEEVVDSVDDTSETPEISGSESEVDGTPETGPAANALLALSLAGAAAYLKMRKRAQVKSF